MKLKLTLIALFFLQIIYSQKSQYNVYEIGKGEIFLKEYFYLEHFYDNLLIATPLKDSVDYDYADLTGIIDLKEDIKLPFKYRNIEKIRDDYKLYKKSRPFMALSNGRGRALFGYSNEIFKQITNFEYLKFRPYLFDGDYLMAYNGYCQLLDLDSEKILKTQFVEAEPLTKGLVATKNMDYNWGVINKKGDTILANDFDRIYKLSDSIITFEKRDSLGIINSNGRIILPPIFKKITNSNSLIIAQTFNNGKKIIIDEKLKQKLSKWTVKIRNGNKLNYVINSIDNKINQNGFFGAFDLSGNLKIPFNYSILEKGIENQLIAKKDKHYGIISDREKIITNFVYDDIKLIFDIFYLLKHNGKTGLSTDTKTVFDTKYSEIFPISKNIVLVNENKTWYKVTLDNNYKVIRKEKTNLNPKFNFNYLESYKFLFSKDFFSVNYNNFYGIIDKNLKIIVPINNQKEPRYFFSKYFELDKNYTVNGVLLEGIDLSRNYYDDSYSFINTIICTKNKKYGVVDTNGKILIPFQYSYIQNIDGSRFIVQK